MSDAATPQPNPDLERIPATTPGCASVNTHRYADIDDHVDALRHEFAGRPAVCLEAIRHIVYLRRRLQADEHWSALQSLVARYEDVFLAELDTRWLLSICDTYSDHGTELERSAAMVIVTCINTIKLAETERLMMPGCQVDWERIKEQSQPVELFDGITSYLVKTGDMPRNMLARIEKALLPTPLLHRIWRAILLRLKHSDNLLSRLARHHTAGAFYEQPPESKR